MKILVSLAIAILILSGCGSGKRVVVKKKELPAWYVNPSKTTSNTLYSVGEGENKAEAVANALNAMVSTLNVSISSEFNTKSVVKEGDVESYQSTTTNEIQSQVEKIRIGNYEILNYEEFGFARHLVLIKSDKRKLFTSFKNELEQRFNAIKSRTLESEKQGVMSELLAYKEALESTYDVKNIVAVMGSLNSGFNGSVYTNKLQELENSYNLLQSKISFSVNSNNDAQRLKPVIANGLSLKKYRIQNSSGKYHFKIYIESNTQRANSYGFDLARCAITIKVKDNNGVIIGSNKLNITGQSTQGYKIAKENVAMRLNKMVKQDGIAKVIGLEI